MTAYNHFDGSAPQQKNVANVQVYRTHDVTFSNDILWTARCD